MTQSQGVPCVLLIAFTWVAWATATNDLGWGGVSFAVAVSAVAAAVAVRSLLLRVDVGDEGLRVVNFFWSARVPWDEVERFEIDHGEHSPSIHGFVVRRDGSRVPITALQTRWVQSVERARRKGVAARRVAELNRLLAARRGEPLPPWPLPRRVASPLTAALLSAGPVAMLLSLSVGVAQADQGAGDDRWALAFLAGMVALPAGAWRTRVRVRADADGVLLAGWWRSRRLPWADLEGFEVTRGPWPLARRVVAVRRDGVRVPAAALTSWLGLWRGLDHKAAELKQILKDQQLAGNPPGSSTSLHRPSTT